MKPGRSAGAPIPLKPTRLLDQVRERIRYLHYSLSTEATYVHWIKFFVRWHGRKGGGTGAMRHPREMGAREVEAFLTMMAVERKVSVFTHRLFEILAMMPRFTIALCPAVEASLAS